MANSIRLADGRRLAFAELGDPRGAAVLHHHGMPGSRLDHEGDFSVYSDLGVRVITADRPGYGLSDPLPGRRLLDWPRDAAALADALGIQQFGVTGLSGGGIFALACAAAMPDRVTRVVVTGCPAPMDWPAAEKGMRAMNIAGMWLGRHAPGLLLRGTGMLAGVVRSHPGFFIREATRNSPPTDRRWLSDALVKAGEKASISEAFRQGGAGYASDIRLLSRPWGFAPEDIRVPVQLWHGDADGVIPLGHGRYLASAIPGSTLVICPGEGHMLMWSHLAEVLTAAAAEPAIVAA